MKRQHLAAALMLLAGSVSGCGPQSGNTANTTAAASGPPALPPAGQPLTDAHLIGYIDAARSFVPKDEFAKHLDDSALVGRTFKVTVPYQQYVSDLSYSYDDASGTLEISVGPTANFHGESSKRTVWLNYVGFKQEDETGSSPEAGSDAIPVRHKIYGLGSVGKDAMGLIPSHPDMITTRYDELKKKIKLTPEAGRALTNGLAMDVEGVVVKSGAGPAISCATSEETGTDDKTHITLHQTWDECMVSVKLSHITVHSPSGGVIAD